jgi:hypothetical protein
MLPSSPREIARSLASSMLSSETVHKNASQTAIRDPLGGGQIMTKSKTRSKRKSAPRYHFEYISYPELANIALSTLEAERLKVLARVKKCKHYSDSSEGIADNYRLTGYNLAIADLRRTL